MAKKYYLKLNGKRIGVSKELYINYWKEKNRDNYLKRLDKQHNLTLFSSMGCESNFVENLADENYDVAKIIETKVLIEAVKSAIEKLTPEEKEIIDRIYYNDETLRKIAESKKISHPALIKKRNKILEKFKELLKDFE